MRTDKEVAHIFNVLRENNLTKLEEEVILPDDMELKNAQGETMLHTAIEHNLSKEIVTSLLQWGSDPNMENRLGLTPTDTAYFLNRKEHLKVMKNFGADTSRYDALSSPKDRMDCIQKTKPEKKAHAAHVR